MRKSGKNNFGVVHFAVLGVIALVGILVFSVVSFQNFSGDFRSRAQVSASQTATFTVQNDSDAANEDGGSFTQLPLHMWLGTGNSTDKSYLGLRLSGNKIPQGATIESAELQFTAEGQTTGAISFDVFAEKSASPQSFSSGASPSTRSLTSGKNSHSDNNTWDAGQTFSFNVKDSVQELVSSFEVDEIALILKGTGSAIGRKYPFSSAATAPRLVIQYTQQLGSISPTATALSSGGHGTTMVTTSPTATPASSPVATVIPTTTVPSEEGHSPGGFFSPGAPSSLLEVGVDLVKYNELKADAAAGMYDRLCNASEHDRTRWHPLVNEAAKCHYDHHHFDDPNYVNDIFGEPGAWFGNSGQSISYPWQTFAAKTYLEPNTEYIAQNKMENNLKHEGYSWIVRRDQPCQNDPNESMCTTDFRLLVHFHGNMDVPVRFHSSSFEARVCYDRNDPSTCGIIRLGGWIDHGRLVTSATPNDFFCGNGNKNFVSLPADTLFFPIDRPDVRDEVRCHPFLTILPFYPPDEPLAQWWGHGPGDRMRYQLRLFDPMGNVNPANPTEFIPFCKAADSVCKYNQSIMSVVMGYVVKIRGGFDVNRGFVDLDPNEDKIVNFKSYMNRWGTINPSCTQAGLDCVPLEYSNILLRGGAAQFKEASSNHFPCESCAKVDHDIAPPGKQWITWFYRYAGM